MNITEISLNLFNKERYSDLGCVNFSFKAINMLEQHDTGQYTARIADFKAALLPFNSKRTKIKIDTGTRIGQTADLDNFMTNLLTSTREQHRLAVYVFQGTTSSKYKEVFPKGLTIFNNLTRDIVRTELDYLIDKGDKYAADLGANFKTVFVNLKTQFNTFRTDQTDTMADLSQYYVEKDQLRETLTLEMTRQYLLFCSENVGNRPLVIKYFVFSIFTIHKHHHKNYNDVKGEVGPGETLMVEDGMKQTDTVELINDCDINLKFGGGTEPFTPMTRTIDVPAHTTVKLLFSAIADPNDTFLKVYNADAEKTGKYIVNIYN